MTVTAWRIVQQKHADEAFTGEGARRYGGRWNRKGTPVVYAAESVSLAALELLVHLRVDDLQALYVLTSVEFDPSALETPAPAELPPDWWAEPPPAEAQGFGTAWAVANRALALKVPSAVVRREFNYLLNPLHPQFSAVTIGPAEPFWFDPRLGKG